MIHLQVIAARQNRSISQRQLAILAGIPRSQLMRLESGENVTLETLQRVLTQLPELELQLMPKGIREAAEEAQAAIARLVALVGSAPPVTAPTPAPRPFAWEEPGDEARGDIERFIALVKTGRLPDAAPAAARNAVDAPSEVTEATGLDPVIETIRRALEIIERGGKGGA
jgi:transcriptional regulator with XRE-family HTH domain